MIITLITLGCVMKIENIDVNKTLDSARKLLEEDTNISPSLRTIFEIMIVIITLFMNRFNLNSKNSSKPPSSDPNREKKSKKNALGKKPGGQKGHAGKNLRPVENPDEVIDIPIDKRSLPKGKYRDVGYDARQVIDIRISKFVTEYRAQILEDQNGNSFVAPFPSYVARPVQYGQDLKAHSVYLSQFQLLTYNRINDYFGEEINVPISMGSIYNFNQEAYVLLKKFDDIAKQKLIQSSVLHVDETGINVNAKNAWVHVTANELWTYFFPHERRGRIAMDEIGILPFFKGTLIHDHWKPYFIYQCIHALCNAHHLRELQRAYEQDNQKWALAMKELLIEINDAVKNAVGSLPEKVANNYCEKYRAIIVAGELESPLPEEKAIVDGKKKRGKIKKSKARNLLERLASFEKDTLRFMEDVDVPFTNNLAENNIRMTKVQQKISGCFRSMEGAYIFCRIRSYISTCRKHGMAVTTALKMLFKGEMPDFISDNN
jgi:transposase